MRTPASEPGRARSSRTATFAAPTAGWISNRNLATPDNQGGASGAAVLDNFFPTATSIISRRGTVLHATLGEADEPVEALFIYSAGSVDKMFGATTTAIYDVAISHETPALDELTNGDWSVVQFSTTGGTFLVGVNGEDDGFLYDGSSFGSLSITFPEGSTLTTADLIYVWAYKERLWFVEKESLNVWYLDVGAIAGELTLLPLGGVFNRGGALVFGQTWSLDSGASGGLSEQNVFVTTRGEVAVYQGDNPDSIESWAKVGVYRIGNPLGSKAFFRAGGDLVIGTTIGAVPLSQAIQRDVAALSPASVSFPIEVAWNDAVQTLQGNWQAELWPEGQMVVFALPLSDNGDRVMFVANARTGAWARFTGWYGRCLGVWQSRLFFGTDDGKIIEAMVGGLDEGEVFASVCVPLFDDLGSPASVKAGRMALPMTRANAAVNYSVSAQYDFDLALPPAPSSAVVSGESAWGVGEWGEAIWGATQDKVVTKQRVSLTGAGYRLSPAIQITSGSVVPLDAELVSIEITYELADAFA